MHIVRLSKLDEAKRIIREKIREKGGDPREYEGEAIDRCAELLLQTHPHWFARNPD